MPSIFGKTASSSPVRLLVFYTQPGQLKPQLTSRTARKERGAQGTKSMQAPTEGRRGLLEGLGGWPLIYSTNLNLRAQVLDFVKSGGPTGMVGGTVFEMWLGAL